MHYFYSSKSWVLGGALTLGLHATGPVATAEIINLDCGKSEKLTLLQVDINTEAMTPQGPKPLVSITWIGDGASKTITDGKSYPSRATSQVGEELVEYSVENNSGVYTAAEKRTCININPKLRCRDSVWAAIINTDVANGKASIEYSDEPTYIDKNKRGPDLGNKANWIVVRQHLNCHIAPDKRTGFENDGL